MIRTVLLGLLGLVLAVTVGFGVHLLTRDTISLPVVQLETPPPAGARPRPAPSVATTQSRPTTSAGTTTGRATEVETGDDNSGSGRGHRGGGDDSRPGGGDD